LKFEDVQEAMEWFVGMCAAQGACEGTFEAMCELEWQKKNHMPIADVTIIVDPEEAMDAKVDIELCMRGMRECEKAALCVYGLLGYRHAATCLSARLPIADIMTYVEMHRDDPEPATSGAMNRRMTRVIDTLEDRLINAGYVNCYRINRKIVDSLEEAA
jgi:hypothetical protein